ncbi:MAG TPA: hypothetical protein PLU20_02250 [Ornithinibacter sp.]|nr:hypothetical protein [Ornithinibacter sp.]HQG16282.1 hypothetical protein [Ornithinibacter sp.]
MPRDAAAIDSRSRRAHDPEVTLFDTIGGIPLHPLIVHAVVVLVPLASLLLLLAAVSPRIRHWAGILPPITATLALVMVPLATQSGESLERRVEASPALEEHTELGDSLLYFVIVLAILAWALWFLDRRAQAAVTTGADASDAAHGTGTAARSPLLTVVIVLSVISVLATTVQVVRIGHSGASASWSDVGAKTVPAGGGDD